MAAIAFALLVPAASAQNYPDHAVKIIVPVGPAGSYDLLGRAGGRSTHQADGAVVRGREPARRRQRHRHQVGRDRAAGRLHAGGRRLEQHRVQHRPLQEPAVQSADRPGAGRADHEHLLHAGRQQRPAVLDAERDHRGGEEESRLRSRSPTPALAPASTWSARRSRRSPARRCWRCRTAARRWPIPMCSAAASTCSSNSTPAALPYVKSGQAKGIAILTAKRHPEMPNVPTMTEVRRAGSRDQFLDRHFRAGQDAARR